MLDRYVPVIVPAREPANRPDRESYTWHVHVHDRPTERSRAAALAIVVAFALASCGVRPPEPIDLAALIAHRGLADARVDLEIRILADPRDVQARLAAAELDERLHAPSDAIEQYEAVERLGGPLGTRWHASDRARFAALLLARGTVRAERDAPNAVGDLTRAQRLGADVPIAKLDRARLGAAITELRHVDGPIREKARAALADLARDVAKQNGHVEPAWAGAIAAASPDQHAAFGVWLWGRGAKREAYEQLAVWHDHARGLRDPMYAAAYQALWEWWSPDAAVAARSAASVTIEVPVQAVVLPAVRDARAEAAAQYARARAAEILAAGLRGADRDQVPPCSGCPTDEVETAALVRIARAFRRDPAVAERYGRELIEHAVDSTLARVVVASLFDALGDPARARSMWLAASEESEESAIVAGYAEAAARAGDGDAALVVATGAAASSGDPAVVWIDVARALLRGNRAIDALTALRSAVDLAGANTLPDALELAAETSRLVGRTEQAEQFAGRRAQLSPPATGHAAQRVELAELAQHAPNASVLAAAWVATRGDPHDIELRAALLGALEADDPRRATLEDELVALSADRDPDRGLAAALSLR